MHVEQIICYAQMNILFVILHIAHVVIDILALSLSSSLCLSLSIYLMQSPLYLQWCSLCHITENGRFKHNLSLRSRSRSFYWKHSKLLEVNKLCSNYALPNCVRLRRSREYWIIDSLKLFFYTSVQFITNGQNEITKTDHLQIRRNIALEF